MHRWLTSRKKGSRTIEVLPCFLAHNIECSKRVSRQIMLLCTDGLFQEYKFVDYVYDSNTFVLPQLCSRVFRKFSVLCIPHTVGELQVQFCNSEEKLVWDQINWISALPSAPIRGWPTLLRSGNSSTLQEDLLAWQYNLQGVVNRNIAIKTVTYDIPLFMTVNNILTVCFHMVST